MKLIMYLVNLWHIKFHRDIGLEILTNLRPWGPRERKPADLQNQVPSRAEGLKLPPHQNPHVPNFYQKTSFSFVNEKSSWTHSKGTGLSK